jgi:hypothetical protein
MIDTRFGEYTWPQTNVLRDDKSRSAQTSRWECPERLADRSHSKKDRYSSIAGRAHRRIRSTGPALRCGMALRCPRCHEAVSFLSGAEDVFPNWRQHVPLPALSRIVAERFVGVKIAVQNVRLQDRLLTFATTVSGSQADGQFCGRADPFSAVQPALFSPKLQTFVHVRSLPDAFRPLCPRSEAETKLLTSSLSQTRLAPPGSSAPRTQHRTHEGAAC